MNKHGSRRGDQTSVAEVASVAVVPSSFILHRSSLDMPLVIVNPASAGGTTGAAWPGIASDLRTHFGAFACVFTEGRGDGTSIAEREARAGRRLIIACGGDGSISEVANGILKAGTDTELGVLPSGTGGDFRRTLGVPSRAADAALALRTGRTLRMDVGCVAYTNHAGKGEQRYFVNVASCGMGGAVVERVKSESGSWLNARASRLLGGKVSFAVAALQTTLTFAKPALKVRLDDGQPVQFNVANLCIANTRYFGGGMKIAPEAKVNDGLLDVVVIGDFGAATILANVHQLYLGTHLGMRQVQHSHARRISVEAADAGERVLLEADGEVAGTLPATFEIVPRALRVRCPA